MVLAVPMASRFLSRPTQGGDALWRLRQNIIPQGNPLNSDLERGAILGQ